MESWLLDVQKMRIPRPKVASGRPAEPPADYGGVGGGDVGVGSGGGGAKGSGVGGGSGKSTKMGSGSGAEAGSRREAAEELRRAVEEKL